MKAKILLFNAILFAGFISASATNHIISFGGSLGLVYSPDSINVAVGDSVTWTGDFSFHPLVSTSVPNGAQSFSNNSGTSFTYVVQVAGTYNYYCNNHHSSGMTGKFVASVSTGVSQAVKEKDIRIFPFVTNNFVNISVRVENLTRYYVEVINAAGKQVLSSALKSDQDRLDLSSFENGYYFIRIKNEGEIVAVERVMKQ